MNVYQRIDETRRAQGVTLAHLNEIIGGYRGKLTEVKNGKTNLTKDELDKIAVALHVSTDYLLGNTDDPRPISAREEQAKPTPTDGGGLRRLTPDKYEEFLSELSLEELLELNAKMAEAIKEAMNK